MSGYLGILQQCSLPEALAWGLTGPSFQPYLGCYQVFEYMVYHLGISESWVVKENNSYLFIQRPLSEPFTDIPQIRKAILGIPKQKAAEKLSISLK